MQGNTECLSPCLLPLGFTTVIWFELLGHDPTKWTLTTWQLQCSTYFLMSFHWCLKVWKLELEQRNHVYSLGMKNRQSDSAKIKSWCHLSPISYLFPFLSLCSERSPLRNPTANSSLQNAEDSTFLTATQLSQPLHEPTLKPNHRCSRILPSSETTDRKSWWKFKCSGY